MKNHDRKAYNPDLLIKIYGYKKSGFTAREIAAKVDETPYNVGRILSSQQYKTLVKEHRSDLDNTIDSVLKEVELEMVKKYRYVIDKVLEGIESESPKERMEMIKLFFTEFKSLRSLSLDSRMEQIEDDLQTKIEN